MTKKFNEEQMFGLNYVSTNFQEGKVKNKTVSNESIC
jgi:hypothetical protein